jgi:hypothetical protein
VVGVSSLTFHPLIPGANLWMPLQKLKRRPQGNEIPAGRVPDRDGQAQSHSKKLLSTGLSKK